MIRIFWIKTTVVYLSLFFIYGCQDQLIYIGNLSQTDKDIAMQIAQEEGLSTTENYQYLTPWVWNIKYGNEVDGVDGDARLKSENRCTITIDTTLAACEEGGRDRNFYITLRHELNHCEGRGHSDDPKNLMYPAAPCWPETW